MFGFVQESLSKICVQSSDAVDGGDANVMTSITLFKSFMESFFRTTNNSEIERHETHHVLKSREFVLFSHISVA